jgi:signal transduction histidine kinase
VAFSWFAAYHLFETTAYLFLSFEMKRLSMMGGSIGLLALILNVDYITKERISYYKIIIASIIIGSTIVLIFIPGNIQLYIHEYGGYPTLGMKGPLQILNIFALFALCFQLTSWFFKTWRRAPPELVRDACYLFLTSLIFYICCIFLFLLGLWLIFPMGYLLTTVSISTITYFIYRQPKLLYILSFKGRRITVITNQTGIPLFDLSWQLRGTSKLAEQKGFVKWMPVLQQLSQKISTSGQVEELRLENSTILFKHANYITTVLLSSRQSPILREALENFTRAFESQYEKLLRVGMNDVSNFREATKLINEIFPLGTTSKTEPIETLDSYLEELVKRRTVELEQINIRLEETEKLKSLFLASMSHELRTPLVSIMGFTELMMLGYSGDTTEDQQQQLNSVYNNARHLLNLINGVLDISKIEAGKFELYPVEFNFNDLLSEVLEALAPKSSEKSLEMSTDLNVYSKLISDEGRIKQVLFNLIGNAIKFTPKGGKISIKTRIVNNEHLKVHIIDNGIGISEEGINKLFRPFQQVDSSSEKSMEGTGLGLYLSKKLVNLLGGEILVKSELGKGSDFNFILPFQIETKA